MAKGKNYFQLLGELERFSADEIGYIVTEAVMTNLENNMRAYRLPYPKMFRRLEEKRVFKSLESIVQDGAKVKIDIQCMKKAYNRLSGKTTKKVQAINFMYDAINFLLSQSEPYPVVFDYINDRLMALKKKDHFITNLPKYRLNDSSVRNHEYNRLLIHVKRKLEEDYSTIFQSIDI